MPSVITASQAFIGLKFIGTARVPHFTLTDQHGAASRPPPKGKVTSSPSSTRTATTSAPSLGAELVRSGRPRRQSAQRRGRHRQHRPLLLRRQRDPAGADGHGTEPRSNVHFLTAPRHSQQRLDVLRDPSKSGPRPTKSDIIPSLYFVSPTCNSRPLATPFAHESSAGVFSLSTRQYRAVRPRASNSRPLV